MTETIRFDRSLYSPESVEAAAAAYAGHAKIVLTKRSDETEASLSVEDGEDLTAVANAFGNHVLFETVLQRRQAALEESRP